MGDLVDEEEPSDEDPMSQAQQTKLMTQIVVVSELLRKITAKAQAEIEQLESRQSKFQKQLMDGDDIADALKQDIYERKDFSVKHSMGALAKEVSDYYSHGLFKIKDKPSVQIIRQWYNEFCKYQKFKQNLQGLRDRESFLEEFNYTRRFYLYLKYEKKLSVNSATEALTGLILLDQPTTADGLRRMTNLMLHGKVLAIDSIQSMIGR